MKPVVFGILLLMVLGSKGQGRFFKGTISDTLGLPVQGVSITVRNYDSPKIIGFGISRVDGNFLIKNLPDSGARMIIDFRHVSYEVRQMMIDSNDPSWRDGFKIQLMRKTTDLKEIVIKREIPVLVRSDTIVFNANSYRDAEVRKVEDMLKKMQGFSVDANGRLSFNGKAVDKVLIDGDDLADKSYQLITKNLDAVTVDKVEVINNYSDNRLLRNVKESDKVGVNLKILSKFKSKFSGGLEAGLAPERRYSADINTIYIKERSKWLMFGNVNNVARDPSGIYVDNYNQEGGQLNYDETGLAETLVLETGNFVLPSIGDRYSRDNSDLAVAVMNSWKIGKKIRLNGMIGYNDLSLRNRAGSLVQTEISDQDQWIIFNTMNMHKRARGLDARVSMKRDGGKDRVSGIDLIVNGARQENKFSNWTGGSITDSLLEKLENGLKGMRFSWRETFLTGRKVLQVMLDLGLHVEEQDLNIRSSRYLQYWGLDSSYIINNQNLEQNKTYCRAAVKVNGKTDRLQYEYAIRSEYLELGYLSKGLVSSMVANPDFMVGDASTNTRNLGLKAMGRLGVHTTRKTWLGISGEGGWETLLSGVEKNSFVSFRGGLGYVKTISLLSSLRVNYTVKCDFDQYDNFYPDELISGNGMILNGLRFKGPEFSHGLIASVNSNNIYRQRSWSANFSFMFMPRRYTGGVEANPEFGIQFFDLTRVNNNLNAGFNWEEYFRNIRGKLGARFSFNAGQYESTVNQVKGISARSGLRMEGWWVSGFSWPVNAELKSTVIYSTGRWNQGELNRNWQYEWSFKMKFRFSESFYSAFLWHTHVLSPRKNFQGLDLFTSYKLGSTFLLSITGSNLLNTGKLLDKMVMPYSKSETGYVLVGRYFLVSISWRF